MVQFKLHFSGVQGWVGDELSSYTNESDWCHCHKWVIPLLTVLALLTAMGSPTSPSLHVKCSYGTCTAFMSGGFCGGSGMVVLVKILISVTVTCSFPLCSTIARPKWRVFSFAFFSALSLGQYSFWTRFLIHPSLNLLLLFLFLFLAPPSAVILLP